MVLVEKNGSDENNVGSTKKTQIVFNCGCWLRFFFFFSPRQSDVSILVEENRPDVVSSPLRMKKVMIMTSHHDHDETCAKVDAAQ